MKKILYTILGISILTSCNQDFINETPSTTLPISETIIDARGLESGVNGIYTALNGEQLNDIINFSEIITDNGMLSNSNNGQYSEIYNMIYSPTTNKINRFWNGMNDLVIKANWVLSYENKLNGGTTDPTLKNLFSEARILRAYGRLQLVSYFCERYGGDNDQLGIPINNNYDPLDFTSTYGRSSVKDTYAAIEVDLQSAIDNMTAEPGVGGRNNTRVGPMVANILMSRVKLYERKWGEVASYVSTAETKVANAGILETLLAAPYPASASANRSSIFEFKINGGNDLGINSLNSYWAQNGSYQQFFATQEFYSLFPSSTSDRRKAIYGAYTSTSDNPTQVYFAKKFGPVGGSTNGTQNDVILVRVAEMFFNKVEASYYTDGASVAKNMLQTWVKANRNSTYNIASLSGSQVLDEILKQRRMEFAFEGFRFMDLKRNDLGWTKGANYQGSHSTVSITDNIQCLPIPNIEMITNPKMVQNPGYN